MNRKVAIVFIAVVLLIAVPMTGIFAQSRARSGRSGGGTTTYTLTVRSNVNGAQVTVSGGGGEKSSSTQTGNIPFSGNFEPGTYTVTVSAPRYQDGTATVNLNGNQTITINLNPLQATIVPTTQHPDFVVIVDGKQQGSGPVKVDPGTHTIEFRIGALSASGTYTFEAGEAYRIQPTLGIDFDF